MNLESLGPSPDEADTARVADIVVGVLAPRIGKFTARKALDLVAARAGTEAEHLGVDHADAIHDALRPMLRTLLGGPTADRVLAEIRYQLDLEAQA